MIVRPQPEAVPGARPRGRPDPALLHEGHSRSDGRGQAFDSTVRPVIHGIVQASGLMRDLRPCSRSCAHGPSGRPNASLGPVRERSPSGSARARPTTVKCVRLDDHEVYEPAGAYLLHAGAAMLSPGMSRPGGDVPRRRPSEWPPIIAYFAPGEGTMKGGHCGRSSFECDEGG